MRVLVGNLVSERGEGLGPGPSRTTCGSIEEHAGGRAVDAVLVHEGPIDGEILARYREEGATPLPPRDEAMHGVQVLRRGLVAAGAKLRHDPAPTARGPARRLA